MKTTAFVFALLAGSGLMIPVRPGVDKKSEDTVVTTKSGLKYLVIKVGEGKEAQSGDMVVVHYVGTFRDGKKLDSSRDRGQPFTFVLGERKVIQGFDEGITGMKVGGQRKLIIPPDLAYGERGSPPMIPPHAELHFDVELLKVTN